MRRVGGLVALLIGCGGSSHDRVERSQVYVLEKGSEPRAMLRYAIPSGTQQSVDVVLDMTMSAPALHLDDTRLPRMVMVEDVDATRYDAKAGTDLAISISDVRVEDRPGAIASAAKSADLGNIRGVRMTGRLTPDGVARNLRFDESSASADVREQLGRAEQIVDDMTAVLPDVPMGKGGRWRVEERIRQGEILADIETSYEVMALSEFGATIHADRTFSAPEQTIHQGGVKVKLESMEGTQTMDLDLDFTKLIDHVKGTSSFDMSLSAGGQEVDMSMEMAIEILPDGETPAPPPPADDDDVVDDAPPP